MPPQICSYRSFFFAIGILAPQGVNPLLLLAVARVLVSTCLTAIEPAARSLLPDTLQQEQIEKGVAFQEVMTQVIQVLVPLLAGVLFSFLHFGWIWMICGSLLFLSIFLEWRIKDNRGNQQHILFTNKQLFSGFSSLFQNKRSNIYCMGQAYSSWCSAAFQSIS